MLTAGNQRETMKKLMIAFVLGAGLLAPDLGAAAPAAADHMDMLTLKIGATTALVNGRPVSVDVGPVIKDQRTLVPFRFLGESLGATVNWDQRTETAVLTTAGLTLQMPVGAPPTVKGRQVPVDVPAQLVNGRLSVPLRFVGEQMGCYVQFDGASQVILIRRVDRSRWKTYSAPNNLSYLIPPDYSYSPDSENKDILTVTTPRGSTLKTYFVSKRPESLVAFYRRQSADAGWTFQQSFMGPTQDPRMGYELRFVKTAPNGTRSILSIFVDPLGTGSNVGEVVCPEASTLTDGFLLYQVMSS